MSFLPPPTLFAAILAGLAIPVLLVALCLGPVAWRHPGRRFQLSVIGGWLLWVPILLALPGDAPRHLLDWLAATAILVAATLLAFVVWSILAYGVTANMLVALARADRPLDLDAWADRFSGGRSLHQICLDRLGHLLLAGLATREGDTVRLVPGRAQVVVAILTAVNFVFGLTQR